VCERLAAAVGVELVTVRRAAGDMMDRWLTRWANNVERYVALECVKVILPWSTPSMRFCTSELKTAVICRELVRRYPGADIVSAVGVRGQESPNRARAPIAAIEAKLRSTSHRTSGWKWNAIHHLQTSEVFGLLAAKGFELHEAYTRYGSTRLSCAYCIMGSANDLAAAASCPDNADVYREMVGLEVTSTFAFQGDTWLGDVAPHLLTPELREGLAGAKQRAGDREAIEARIPKHLLYAKGWPTCIPTASEAELLCEVRSLIGAVLELPVQYVEPAALIARYQELFDLRRAAEARVCAPDRARWCA
jgi:3'-phosphoadenosine 5'-phosphosulfate sulfotransferase (PAPS reductase)/FAD synthetase